MPKQQIKHWLPKPEELRKYKIINAFAPFLADPRLWYLNRTALLRAVFIGVMCAFFPLPGQMPLALIFALIFRANIPMSIALTWLTNPLTTLPIFWFSYWVGAVLLGEPAISIHTITKVSADVAHWIFQGGAYPFTHSFFSLKVFGVGLLITGVITSLIMCLVFHLFWRYRIIQDWQKRHGYQPHAPKFRTQKNKKSPKG